MGADQFLLTWNNHRANFASVFSELRLQGQLVDVTLLCDGGSFPAHRLVLAACSPYFATLFSTLDSSHPLIFLRDVRQAELEALLEFIYRGQVSVANSELGGLIKIAESLRIKGLGDVSQRDPASSPPPPNYQQQQPQRTSSPVRGSLLHHPQQQFNKHGSKRAASPCTTDASSTYTSGNNGGPRTKKAARRAAASSNNSSTPALNRCEETVKSSTGSVYLPDFSALLTAASTYSGLAATFPALAAVSAAAAEYTRQNGGGAGTGGVLEESSKAEDGPKLRWCLEKGREQTLPTKLKMEQPEQNEMSMDGDDANSSTEGGNSEDNNNSNSTCHQTQQLAAAVDSSGSVQAAAASNEESSAACHLLQQLYAGGSSGSTDVSSLLSTYQQLLTSTSEGSAPQGEDAPPSVASTGAPPSQPPSLIPSTVQDASAQAKDAKCLTCHLCGATIKHTANFRRHMKQHLNPRRFPCPWCNAAFGRKDNLKTHTRKHHPSEVEAQEGAGVSSSAAPECSDAGEDAATTPSHAPADGDKDENGDLSNYSPNDEEEEDEEGDDKGDDCEGDEDDEVRPDEDSLVIDEDEEDDEDEE